MMGRYTVTWGYDENADTGQFTTEVSTIEELDAVLDRVAAEAAASPQLLDIYPAGWSGLVPPGLQLGIGHPDRATVVYADADGSAYGFDPALPEWPEPISFDYGGQWTELDPKRTRVTPEAARQAAREYVEVGERPTSVEWE
jgi:hypothetical protein